MESEREICEICEECDEDPDTCGYDPEECEESARLDSAESDWEGMRDSRD